MSKKKKVEEVEEIEVQEINIEELLERISENRFIEEELIKNSGLCEEKFKKGLEDMSYEAGRISTLLKVGISTSDAIAYILTEKTMINNIDVAKINQTTSIEVSKNQCVIQKDNLI
jgi:hypothetical protein